MGVFAGEYGLATLGPLLDGSAGVCHVDGKCAALRIHLNLDDHSVVAYNFLY